MAFDRPTLTEIIDRITADFVSRLNLTGALLRNSVVRVLSRVYAGAVHGLYGYLDFLSRQLIPDTAEDEYLQAWADTWGISRQPATYASGPVVFTGTDSSVIPAGSVLQASDGSEYETQADATITGGTVTATVEAQAAGAAGNLSAGVTLSLVSPISGVDNSATVDTGGITGGTDIESDESLRARLLARIQQPPQGGAAHDYENWALEVVGVTRAFVFPLRYGLGTVGVTFVLDGEASIIPDAGKVAEVQDYIDERRPVTADVTVFAPVEVQLDMTIKLEPNTAAVQAAVTAEIADLIRRESEPDGFLYVSQLDEAISIAQGEIDHEIVSTSPAEASGRIQAGTDGLITLGTLTFQSF